VSPGASFKFKYVIFVSILAFDVLGDNAFASTRLSKGQNVALPPGRCWLRAAIGHFVFPAGDY